MKIQTYKKQNRIQKELNDFIRLFKADQEAMRYFNDRGIEVYNPKPKKLKVSVSFCLIGLCLITPFTNLFIYKIVKWGLE